MLNRIRFVLWRLTPVRVHLLRDRFRRWRFERYVKAHPPIPGATLSPEMKQRIAVAWQRAVQSGALPPGVRDEVTDAIADLLTEGS